MPLINVNINYSEDFQQILNTLNTKITQIMASITELTVKVDELQVALDAEQEQVAAAIAALQTAVADLQALVADGGTPEQRQALLEKIDAIKVDLEGTVA